MARDVVLWGAVLAFVLVAVDIGLQCWTAYRGEPQVKIDVEQSEVVANEADDA